MTATIIVVSLVLAALFVAVAIVGNRAQTRMVERDRARERGEEGPG